MENSCWGVVMLSGKKMSKKLTQGHLLCKNLGSKGIFDIVESLGEIE